MEKEEWHGFALFSFSALIKHFESKSFVLFLWFTFYSNDSFVVRFEVLLYV
jgi:hypothetical protein